MLTGLITSVYRLVAPEERRFARAWPLIDSVEGYLSAGQERWLFLTARGLRDGATIVEIGTYKGRSTASIGLACVGTSKRLFSIDTFDGNESDFQGPGRRAFFLEWRSTVVRLDLEPYVTPVVGDSRVVSRGWKDPIDFLFIDASHVYEDVVQDFDNLFPYVVDGGVVALHDVGTHDGPTRVWAERRHLLRNRGTVSNLAYGRKA